MVTRWKLDVNGSYFYEIIQNPNRQGGDSGWKNPLRSTEVNILGANESNLQLDGVSGAKRTLTFTSVPGTMKRTLEDFFLRQAKISNCRDHLYPTTAQFNCYILEFTPNIRPSLFDEDRWDLTIVLMKVS